MCETAVESHPFRKVREKDGAPGVCGIPGLEKRETWGTPGELPFRQSISTSERPVCPLVLSFRVSRTLT
jgi:hypothetical protein